MKTIRTLRCEPVVIGASAFGRPLKSFFVFFLVASVWIRVAVPQQVRAEVLTNAIDVLSLPGERAWGRDVSIHGVVTAAEPQWGRAFFAQDATAGIFAESSNQPQPTPGDFVEITGISHPGGYAPFISYAHWVKLGTAPLPVAKPVSIEQLMAGIEDGQRVEISGTVRSVVGEKPVWAFEVISGGHRLKVNVPPLKDKDPQKLVGASVRLRGTASAVFSGQLRQLIRVVLHVPFQSDFIVEKTDPSEPFSEPVLPLNSLGQFGSGRELGKRVHVRGAVTYQRPGEDVFLRDATGGLQVKSSQLAVFTPGEVVEAVGFWDFEQSLPVLQDAVFRKTKEPIQKVEPKPATIGELQAGYRHADLIQLQGKVLDRNQRRAGEKDGGLDGQTTILTLQSGGVVFSVEAFALGPNQALAQIPVGSTVEVDGICFMHIAEDGKLQSFQMFLPTAGDLRILRKPDWLTPQRMLIGVVILLAVWLRAIIWALRIIKRNIVLRELIREKEQAQTELQQANDLLDERVKERTAQLKFQITARKETELQYKAVLSERTRMAQELHDTLEQTLTGIRLQLDITSKLFAEKSDTSNHHLKLAHELVSQSQMEVRRSVWDLRSRTQEQFDLPGALATSSRQLLEGSKIHFEINTKGQVRPLPEIIEENLLRIAQEAMTNVMKHSEATAAGIELDYGPNNVTLRIRDNGRGFDLNQCAGPTEGHFGLLGITERTKRLGAALAVKTEPGAGTIVTVQIGVEQRSQPGENTEPEVAR